MIYLGHNFRSIEDRDLFWYICSKCNIVMFKRNYIRLFPANYMISFIGYSIPDITCNEYIIKNIIE